MAASKRGKQRGRERNVSGANFHGAGSEHVKSEGAITSKLELNMDRVAPGVYTISHCSMQTECIPEPRVVPIARTFTRAHHAVAALQTQAVYTRSHRISGNSE